MYHQRRNAVSTFAAAAAAAAVRLIDRQLDTTVVLYMYQREKIFRPSQLTLVASAPNDKKRRPAFQAGELKGRAVTFSASRAR